VLPGSYQAGSPVIVDSPSRWLNVYMQDWLLDGLPTDSTFHITSESEPLFNQNVEARLGDHIATDFDTALNDIAALVDDHQQVWYLFAAEVSDHEAALTAQLDDFLPTVVPITQPDYSDAAFTLIRFQRPPDDLAESFRFGENVTLQGWNIANECEPLLFESWWLADEMPELNYSSTLVLEDSNGEVIAQSDAGLANIPMQLWSVGQFYFDARALDVPCGLPPGDYTLKFGVYDVETLARLPVTDENGEAVGELAEITQLELR
jgi:hypothetical protein